MSLPLAPCPVCKAVEDAPCLGPDGKPCAGIHSERVLAATRALFGAFSPPVPKVNGPSGGRA